MTIRSLEQHKAFNVAQQRWFPSWHLFSENPTGGACAAGRGCSPLETPRLSLSISVLLTALSCFSDSSSGIPPAVLSLQQVWSERRAEPGPGGDRISHCFCSQVTPTAWPPKEPAGPCLRAPQRVAPAPLDLWVGWKTPLYEFYLGITSLSLGTIT